MLVGQVVVEPVHKIGSFLELGSFQGPGGVFVFVDDLPLAEETLESGGGNHHPTRCGGQLVAFGKYYNYP